MSSHTDNQTEIPSTMSTQTDATADTGLASSVGTVSSAQDIWDNYIQACQPIYKSVHNIYTAVEDSFNNKEDFKRILEYRGFKGQAKPTNISSKMSNNDIDKYSADLVREGAARGKLHAEAVRQFSALSNADPKGKEDLWSNLWSNLTSEKPEREYLTDYRSVSKVLQFCKRMEEESGGSMTNAQSGGAADV